MANVFMTTRGDRHHATAECRWIVSAHKTAATKGYQVFPAREVSPAEAVREGKTEPCPLCGGTA